MQDIQAGQTQWHCQSSSRVPVIWQRWVAWKNSSHNWTVKFAVEISEKPPVYRDGSYDMSTDRIVRNGDNTTRQQKDYYPSRQDSSKTRENTRNSHFLSVRTRVPESGLVNIRKIRILSVTTDKIALFNIFTLKNVQKVTSVSVFIFIWSWSRVRHPKV